MGKYKIKKQKIQNKNHFPQKTVIRFNRETVFTIAMNKFDTMHIEKYIKKLQI